MSKFKPKMAAFGGSGRFPITYQLKKSFSRNAYLYNFVIYTEICLLMKLLE